MCTSLHRGLFDFIFFTLTVFAPPGNFQHLANSNPATHPEGVLRNPGPVS